jgi:hypothetical protein
MQDLYDSLMQVGWYDQAERLLPSEAKLLVRKILNFTPPLKSKLGPARISGEMAIKNELNNLFSEAQQGMTDDVLFRFGKSHIDAWVTHPGGGERTNLKWDYIAERSEMMGIYRRSLSKKGKVIPKLFPKRPGVWFARNVVPIGSVSEFMKPKLARVGRWKASWAKAGSELGDKFPSWIQRQIPLVGNISRINIAAIKDPVNQFIEFTSGAPGVGRTRRDIQAAVNARGKVMARRLGMLINRFAHRMHASTEARIRENLKPEPQETIQE